MKSDPEFQTVLPSPRFSKNSVSSAVAPVMAKLAPRAKLAFLALEGGRNGSPSSCAAKEQRNQNASNSEQSHFGKDRKNRTSINRLNLPMKSTTRRPSEHRPVGYPK